MKRKIQILIVILSLSLLMTPLLTTTSRAEGRPVDKTNVYGETTSDDSNFIFTLKEGNKYRFLYPDLNLYLQTWSNSSQYQIYVNGKKRLNGTIYRGTSKVNLTLPVGSAVDITIQIGDDRYEYKNKLVTDKSVESGWTGPGGPTPKYTESELNSKVNTSTAFAIFGTLLGVGIATGLAYLRKSGQIREVFE